MKNTVIIAVIIAGAFLAYQNVSNIKAFRMALEQIDLM
jgi:hypothetical protein